MRFAEDPELGYIIQRCRAVHDFQLDMSTKCGLLTIQNWRILCRDIVKFMTSPTTCWACLPSKSNIYWIFSLKKDFHLKSFSSWKNFTFVVFLVIQHPYKKCHFLEWQSLMKRELYIESTWVISVRWKLLTCVSYMVIYYVHVDIIPHASVSMKLLIF